MDMTKAMGIGALCVTATVFCATSALTDTLPLQWTPPSGMTPGPVAGSEAILSVSAEGASMQLTTSGITPGHAITIWFVAVQNPEGCAKNPCSPNEAMGMAEMNTVVVNGGGTVKPETSEYHLVIHDHGPLIPKLAPDMLSSFRGGCTLDSVPPHYPDSARTDGAGGPNTCVSRQVALFVPSHLKNN